MESNRKTKPAYIKMKEREKMNLPEINRINIAVTSWIKIFFIRITSSDMNACEWSSLYNPVDREEKYHIINKAASNSQMLFSNSSGDDNKPVIELT